MYVFSRDKICTSTSANFLVASNFLGWAPALLI